MERNIKNQKGITLVALVITIIVMLILVAVSVTVAINGGLFTKAKEAGNEWEDKSAEEAAGNIVKVNVDGTETTMNIDSTINTLKERPKTQTPGATTISFTITGLHYTGAQESEKTYTITEEKKWGEWIAEPENTGLGLTINDYGNIGLDDATTLYVGTTVETAPAVKAEDPIQNGQTYTLSQW